MRPCKWGRRPIQASKICRGWGSRGDGSAGAQKGRKRDPEGAQSPTAALLAPGCPDARSRKGEYAAACVGNADGGMQCGEMAPRRAVAPGSDPRQTPASSASSSSCPARPALRLRSRHLQHRGQCGFLFSNVPTMPVNISMVAVSHVPAREMRRGEEGGMPLGLAAPPKPPQLLYCATRRHHELLALAAYPSFRSGSHSGTGP